MEKTRQDIKLGWTGWTKHERILIAKINNRWSQSNRSWSRTDDTNILLTRNYICTHELLEDGLKNCIRSIIHGNKTRDNYHKKHKEWKKHLTNCRHDESKLKSHICLHNGTITGNIRRY